MRTSVLLVLISACAPLGDRASTGKCPTGEVCSPETPEGLLFFGPGESGDFLATGPGTTAVGGQQTVRLANNDALNTPFDLPFDAVGGDAVGIAGAAGSVVTLQGLAAGTNELRIVDPAGALYDRTSVDAATLDHIRVITGYDPTISVAFATGSQDIPVALLDATNGRLVDTAMTLATPGGVQTAWDTLHFDNAPAGTSSIAITAAGATQTSLAVDFVAGADDIALAADQSGWAAGSSQMICFEAHNADRLVVGLPDWSFTTDDGKLDANPLSATCPFYTPANAGTAHVHASAGGASFDATVEVAAANHPKRPRPTTHDVARTAAGERASM